MSKKSTLEVRGTLITVLDDAGQKFISLTDMLKAKNGDFFIADWLRNRNTVEFLGIWESVYNPSFNYGEFATIRNQAGLNNYKISVKEWVAATNAIGLKAKTGRYDSSRLEPSRSAGTTEQNCHHPNEIVGTKRNDQATKMKGVQYN